MITAIDIIKTNCLTYNYISNELKNNVKIIELTFEQLEKIIKIVITKISVDFNRYYKLYE